MLQFPFLIEATPDIMLASIVKQSWETTFLEVILSLILGYGDGK